MKLFMVGGHHRSAPVGRHAKVAFCSGNCKMEDQFTLLHAGGVALSPITAANVGEGLEAKCC